jgi:crotonobetainyl-CoA:carnitine CoA-transferase CaiB-like acyl-CoA transferase
MHDASNAQFASTHALVMTANSRVADTPGPLAGIRVFDVTRVLAGPFCTMILADLGAEVIKVEGPGTPDYARSIPPHVGATSHYFLSINRKKKSIAIDLKQPAGQDLAVRLALTCDVVVENFRPGTLARLGLSYATLSERKPDIIVCSLSGYGQHGRLAGKAAVDTVVQALSGAMSVTGEADGPPVKLGLPMGDLAGSMWAAVGILAALHRRDATGRGDHVDVSLLDGLIGLQSYLAELYLVTGRSPGRIGSGHHVVPAYGRYAVADGHLVLAAQMDTFWRNFCKAAGRPELADDPRFSTVGDRSANFEEVERLVSEILLTKGLAEWTALLDEADVPHAPVLSIGEALEQPHARERGLVHEIDQPGSGKVRVTGPIIKFLASIDPPALGHAPVLGEHTRRILTDIGLPDGEIDELLARGVVSEDGGEHGPAGVGAASRPHAHEPPAAR